MLCNNRYWPLEIGNGKTSDGRCIMRKWEINNIHLCSKTMISIHTVDELKTRQFISKTRHRRMFTGTTNSMYDKMHTLFFMIVVSQ